MTFLVGDVGGTKTVLAYYNDVTDFFSTDNLKHQKSYLSSKYNSLEDIISLFISEFSLKVTHFVIAIAGPVSDGKSILTNLPWILEESKIKKRFSFEDVKFLNDLEASAYFIPYLNYNDLEVLQQGTLRQNGTIAVISPGTGLGEAFLTWNVDRYVAHATEGGHTSFSPENEEQDKLLQYLRRKLGKRISMERFCSGIGVKNIFDFLVDSGYKIEPESLANELSTASDPVAVILSTGTNKMGQSKICDKTIEIFVSILGSESGNLALKTMSLGGIFIGGGIPPKILPFILKTNFYLDSLLDKGRMTPLLKRIPVMLIKNQNTTLLGCARYCFDSF